MHELSVAEAVLDLVREQAPGGARVLSLRMEAGPLRGIVPEAMQWSWQVVIEGTEYEKAQLDLEILPWILKCPDCGKTFKADDMFDICKCGGGAARPVGGTELRLLSIEVEDEPQAQTCAGEGTEV